MLNSLVYRLKTGVRYKGIPKSEDYAAKSPVYYWLGRGSEEGVLEAVWRRLLSRLEAKGQPAMTEGNLDGGFVSAKRGVRQSGAQSRATVRP